LFCRRCARRGGIATRADGLARRVKTKGDRFGGSEIVGSVGLTVSHTIPAEGIISTDETLLDEIFGAHSRLHGRRMRGEASGHRRGSDAG